MLEEQNFIRKDSIEDRSNDINIFLRISPILLENKTLLVTVATHGKEKVKMLKLYDGFIQYSCGSRSTFCNYKKKEIFNLKNCD